MPDSTPPLAAPQDELPPASTSPQDLSGVLLEVVREMSAQRRTMREAEQAAEAERKSERRWKRFNQLLFFGAPLFLGFLYFVYFISVTNVNLGPVSDVVGVVRIDGQIGPGTRASAEKIIPALEKAFADRHVKAVVLAIDSPGGSPTESEAIVNAISMLKKKHNKEVVSVISNLGASAAYMVAVKTDKVWAGRYSLVGSIGAIMTGWDVHRLAERLDVEQRVFASGNLKALLNPFQPSTAAADAKAREIVMTMGSEFLDLVKSGRGEKLKADVDYATGEVWGGTKALEIGLIDGIGTLDQVIEETWGLKAHDFGPHKETMSFLSAAFDHAVATAMDRFLSQPVSIR